MLRILNAHNAQLNYYSVDPLAIFFPGMMAELVSFGCGPSYGSNPIGIIDAEKTLASNTCNNGLVPVWTDIGLQFETDVVENDVMYAASRAPLYCSTNGKFTISPQSTSIIVAEYISHHINNFGNIVLVAEWVRKGPIPAGQQVVVVQSMQPINSGTNMPNHITINNIGGATASNITISGIDLDIPVSVPDLGKAKEDVKYGVTCASCKEYFPYTEYSENFRCYSCRITWS